MEKGLGLHRSAPGPIWEYFLRPRLSLLRTTMKSHLLLGTTALASLLFLSCDNATNSTSGSGPSVPTEAPAPPSPEVVSALQAQSFGKNLLGKTMLLVGDQFVAADLQSAPEYYLIHYSASW